METIDFNTVITENISVVEGLLPMTGYNKKGIVSSNLSIYLPNYTVKNDTGAEKYIKILRLTPNEISLYLSVYSTRADSNYAHVEVEVYKHNTTSYTIRGASQTISQNQETYTPKFYIDKQNNDLYMSLKEYVTATIIVRSIKGDVSGVSFDCVTETETVEYFTLLTTKFQ